MGFTPALWAGIGCMAVSVVLAATVFVLSDQLVQPDHGAVLEDRSLPDDAAIVAELRRSGFYAVRANERWVRWSRTFANVQLITSLAAWTATVIWLVDRGKT